LIDAETEWLLDMWYRYVSMDHHKERDCHWYVSTDFRYGHETKYTVYHDGYICDESVYFECSSYKEALAKLKDAVLAAFRSQLEWSRHVIAHPDEYDGVQYEQASLVIDVLRGYNA